MNTNTEKKDKPNGLIATAALVGIIVVLYTVLTSNSSSTPKKLSSADFKAGDCLTYINGGGYVYQVVQAGEHSLRVAKRLTESVEDTMIFENDIQNNVQKADCFDLFKTGLPVK